VLAEQCAEVARNGLGGGRHDREWRQPRRFLECAKVVRARNLSTQPGLRPNERPIAHAHARVPLMPVALPRDDLARTSEAASAIQNALVAQRAERTALDQRGAVHKSQSNPMSTLRVDRRRSVRDLSRTHWSLIDRAPVSGYPADLSLVRKPIANGALQ